MEMWGQQTCDNLDASDTCFCIIEGIYGRNGNGFGLGPGLGHTAQDFMTNVLIFGMGRVGSNAYDAVRERVGDTVVGFDVDDDDEDDD